MTDTNLDAEAAEKLAEISMVSLDAETFTRSLTGFDEIAVRVHFGSEFADLGGTMSVRALLFVRFRRAGLKDKAAYNATMCVSLGWLEHLFTAEPKVDDDEGKDQSPGSSEPGQTSS